MGYGSDKADFVLSGTIFPFPTIYDTVWLLYLIFPLHDALKVKHQQAHKLNAWETKHSENNSINRKSLDSYLDLLC